MRQSTITLADSSPESLFVRYSEASSYLFNMKAIVLCVLAVLALTASASACPGSCPPHRNPVCGFDGMCLYNFNNVCEMIRYNCQRGGHFRNSSPSQCQSAKNGSGLYQYCRHINGF